jgi:hypothetical protein
VLGLEIHERAHVFAVEVPGSEVSLVPPRRYVLLRVQVADINIVEQQACRMLQEELDLLGISSGDVVVLEGCLPRDSEMALSYEVSTVRLKAYAVPEELLAQRARNSGGIQRSTPQGSAPNVNSG